MFSFTKWIVAPALALGLTLAGDAPEAKAQYGCGYGYGGGGGIGLNVGIGRYGGYGSYRVPSYRTQHRSFYGHRPWYHDTTHLDWHPTEIIRHRNHYHIQRGHYDLHRSGHWHR